MTEKPDIACVILAGGASVRFGGDKGLAALRGRPLIGHVVERLRAQTGGVVGVNAAEGSLYASFADVVVPDLLGGGLGPLAGLHAALTWAKGQGDERVVTCAVDTPFLPGDLIERFLAADGPAVAASGGRVHPVCGIWPVGLLAQLEAMLEAGGRAVMGWVDACGAQRIEFAALDGLDPFFNINTVEDLAAASKL